MEVQCTGCRRFYSTVDDIAGIAHRVVSVIRSADPFNKEFGEKVTPRVRNAVQGTEFLKLYDRVSRAHRADGIPNILFHECRCTAVAGTRRVWLIDDRDGTWFYVALSHIRWLSATRGTFEINLYTADTAPVLDVQPDIMWICPVIELTIELDALAPAVAVP